jgi:hypothetical protein
LLLSALITNNALIVTAGWTRFRLRRALLAAMFAALILYTFPDRFP